MDVLDGGEIEMLAPDEALDEIGEAGARHRIAGDGTRLDHRRAFPVLPEALVIGLGGDQRQGGGGRAGIGAQAQVDAEDIAVGGTLVEDLGQVAGQRDEEFLR